MQGQIEQGRTRQDGPGVYGNLGTVSREVTLIIFKDPLFKSPDFGVRNKSMVPGYNPSDFVGLDGLGWGVHPDGSINVIDQNQCHNGFGTSTPNIGWSTLWNLEANQEEFQRAQRGFKEGYKIFLDRMIKSVKVSMAGVQTIPDPRLWLVSVSQDNAEALGDTAVGKLVPWSSPTPQIEELRRSTFSLRPVNIEFNGPENQQWPKNRSPAT